MLSDFKHISGDLRVKIMQSYCTRFMDPSYETYPISVLTAVADSRVSGPWGPQFCGALCYGETQRLPAGGAGRPPVGSEAGPRTQTHFGNNIGPIENWLKIKYLGRCLHP